MRLHPGPCRDRCKWLSPSSFPSGSGAAALVLARNSTLGAPLLRGPEAGLARSSHWESLTCPTHRLWERCVPRVSPCPGLGYQWPWEAPGSCGSDLAGGGVHRWTGPCACPGPSTPPCPWLFPTWRSEPSSTSSSQRFVSPQRRRRLPHPTGASLDTYTLQKTSFHVCIF